VAAQAPRGSPAAAAAVVLLLAGVTLLLEPAGRRWPAAALLAVGLAVGVALGRRLRPRRRRTMMERLNDGAFVVVLAAVSLLALGLLRPWTAVLPGLLGGVLLGRAGGPRSADAEAGGVEDRPAGTPPADPGATPRPGGRDGL
jgi:hypothetical protein